MACGKFGFVDIEDIIKGIRCKQFLKFSDPEYDHPLKNFIIAEGVHLQLSRNLKKYADEVAKSAHIILREWLIKILQYVSTDHLILNLRLAEQISTLNFLDVVKPGKIETRIFTEIIHIDGSERFGDLLRLPTNRYTKIKQILKKG